MIDIKNKVIEQLGLKNRINCDLLCYLLDSERYIIFYDKEINRINIKDILEEIDRKCNSDEFSAYKSIIVFSTTSDSFLKKELLYFNSINTFVVFYLINKNSNKIYMNDKMIFTLGLNYKKYVKKINEI